MVFSRHGALARYFILTSKVHHCIFIYIGLSQSAINMRKKMCETMGYFDN